MLGTLSVAVPDELRMRVVLPAQVSVGGVLSTLVTGIVQEEELPEASVTVIVTVLVPAPERTVPAAGDWVTTSDPEGVQLSLADTRLV